MRGQSSSSLAERVLQTWRTMADAGRSTPLIAITLLVSLFLLTAAALWLPETAAGAVAALAIASLLGALVAVFWQRPVATASPMRVRGLAPSLCVLAVGAFVYGPPILQGKGG